MLWEFWEEGAETNVFLSSKVGLTVKVVLLSRNECTLMQTHTYTSIKANLRLLPQLFKIFSSNCTESLASQWATLLACPLQSSDSKRMQLREGLVALYSLHSEILTPPVLAPSPLTSCLH